MKVLVPIDGSEGSMAAARRALEIAEKVGAEITLMRVVRLGDFDDMPPNIREKMVRDAKESLETAKTMFDAKNIKVDLALEEGLVPANNIIRKAEEEKFDRIVIGSTGAVGLAKIFIGSTAAKVVAHAPCEVTVVR